MKLYTIGVYGYSEEDFFGTLADNKIDLFIDIRARRGMRQSSPYKFVNSTYLQWKLKECGIEYVHLKALAPTDEIRALQRKADEETKLRKRDRIELSESYINAYKKEILKTRKRKAANKLNVLELLAEAREAVGNSGALPLSMVLFCVEANPNACHRSIAYLKVREELKNNGYEVKRVKHIRSKSVI